MAALGNAHPALMTILTVFLGMSVGTLSGVARHVGARYIVVTDINEYRLVLAEEMGTEVPDEPILFFKPSSALLASGQALSLQRLLTTP